MPDRTAGRCASRHVYQIITEDDTSPVCHTLPEVGKIQSTLTVETFLKPTSVIVSFIFVALDIDASDRNSSTVIQVWKQWADENRTTQKSSNGRRKVTSASDDQHLFRMAVNYRTASSRQLEARWSTATESPSRQTIDGCVCDGLISTEPGKLIGTKLSFQMNHASICETMMAASMVDAIPVNAAFQRALSNDIGA
ncbi:uncharacterized protein TNCV_3489641 [Trichonephila clavipes]|nr:uncharacterized protein TNCV_3489641 [Trichonephila clavipes]